MIDPRESGFGKTEPNCPPDGDSTTTEFAERLERMCVENSVRFDLMRILISTTPTNNQKARQMLVELINDVCVKNKEWADKLKAYQKAIAK